MSLGIQASIYRSRAIISHNLGQVERHAAVVERVKKVIEIAQWAAAHTRASLIIASLVAASIVCAVIADPATAIDTWQEFCYVNDALMALL